MDCAAHSSTTEAGTSAEKSSECSRRRVLKGGASLPGLGALAAGLASLATTDESRAASPTSVDIDKNALLARLVRRITWGFTQEEYALAQQLGYDGYLEYHLNPQAIDDSALDARLAAYSTLNMLPYQLFPLTGIQVEGELAEAMMLRAIYSKRQLFERVVEFWSDHFNVDTAVDLVFYLNTVEDRTVIRANAMGTFPQMLRASAFSPCMYQYLSNNSNIASAPNENYARELMELHTLSAAGPYTQNDVREVARCLTGCSFGIRSNTNPTSGLFLFEAVYHDNGPKTVLGNEIPAGGGVQDVHDVVDILSVHPSTASHIATKLTKRFLGEDVSQSIIDAVAAVYVSSSGDIRSMLREILKPEHVATDFGPRYKRPQHLMYSALRVLPTPITSTTTLRLLYMNSTGHIPFNWSTPDGYPDTLAHWNGLVLPRWNFCALVVTDAIPGITFDVEQYFAGLTTAQEMIDHIDYTLFGNELPGPEKAQLLAYLNVNPADSGRRRDTVGLAISAPSFQWY